MKIKKLIERIAVIMVILSPNAYTQHIVPIYDFLKETNPKNIKNAFLANIDVYSCSGIEKLSLLQHPKDTREDCISNYKITLPEISAEEYLMLSFWYGVRDGINFADKVHPFDGVMFKIAVNNESAFEDILKENTWKRRLVDISKYSGKSVEISFITNCILNSYYDWAIWSEPLLLYLKDNILKGILEVDNKGELKGWECEQGTIKVSPYKDKEIPPQADKKLLSIASGKEPAVIHLKEKLKNIRTGILVIDYKLLKLKENKNIEIKLIAYKYDAVIDSYTACGETKLELALQPSAGNLGIWERGVLEFNFVKELPYAVDIVFAIPEETEFAIDGNLGLYTYSPEIVIEHFGSAKALSLHTEDVKLISKIKNIGKDIVKEENNVKLSLFSSQNINLTEMEKNITNLLPNEEKEVIWTIGKLPAGRYKFDLSVSGENVLLPKDNTNSIEVEVYPSPMRSKEYAIKKPVKESVVDVYPDKDVVVLENTNLRLVFNKVNNKILFADIYAFDKEIKKAGIIYPLCKFIVRSNKTNKDEEYTIAPEKYDLFSTNFRSSAIFNEIFTDANDCKWKINMTYETYPGAHFVKVNYILEALDKDGEIVHFSGPVILAGEGSYEDKKDYALFPGVEYLEKDEVSSSTTVAKGALGNRWAPPVWYNTIPLMAIQYGNIAVGLLWSAVKGLNVKDIYPQPYFFSPNLKSVQKNHIMTLFLPGGNANYINPNETVAHTPYKILKGQKVSFEFYIFAKPVKEIYEVINEWIKIYNLPEPVKEPRSFEEELELSRKALTETLWDKDKLGWRHATGWEAGQFPGFCYLLKLDSYFCKDERIKEKLIKQVNMVAEKIVKDAGAEKLASGEGCHVLGWEFPFHYGYLEESLHMMKKVVDSLISSQQENGGWPFKPTKQTEFLGPAGEFVLGTSARNAYTILKYSRITGDKTALTAGIKALEHMKSFKVPRGAQTWECPLYAPDILASALAMASYLEGYVITKKEEYLELAKHWAYTGLPFVYLWNYDDKPQMLYATIPVFGATFYTWPWFGRPVQWCGLVYAYFLRKLAKYDTSFPWEKIANGITVSGMLQQITPQEDKEKAGTYPDSLGEVFTKKDGPYVNPEDILINAYFMFAKKDIDIDTVYTEMDIEEIIINSGAEIRDVVCDEDKSSLSFKLKHFPKNGVYTLIISGQEPKRILEDDKVLQKREDVCSPWMPWLKKSCWFYKENKIFLYNAFPNKNILTITVEY